MKANVGCDCRFGLVYEPEMTFVLKPSSEFSEARKEIRCRDQKARSGTHVTGARLHNSHASTNKGEFLHTGASSLTLRVRFLEGSSRKSYH
jgi:hypothetical protein